MRPLMIRSALGRCLRVARRWPLVFPRGWWRVLSLALALLVFAGSGTQVAFAWLNRLPADAVLRAGGTVITQQQFDQRMHVLQALYGVQPPQGDTDRAQFDKDAAKSLAISLIMDRVARDRGIVISDKQAEDALTKIINQQLPTGQAGFTAFLTSQGLSQQDVLDEIKRQLATSQLFTQVTATIQPVTEQDTQEAYHNRKDQMVAPEKRDLRVIVVDSPEKAAQVLQQVRSGVPFSTAAAQNSLDATTRSNGGELGLLTVDQLDPAFGKAAFATQAGEVFGPVQTSKGWNVGQVGQVQPATPLSFDQVHDQLKQALDNERHLGVWRDWLAQQIVAARVEYADAYRPDDPDAPPAESPVGGQ